MNGKSFVPRVVWPQDVVSFNNDKIMLQPELARFYEITEILKYGEHFFMLVAVDRQTDCLTVEDVSDRVKIY